MSIFEYIWQTHAGLIYVAIIIGTISLIAFVNDEWVRKKRRKDSEKK